MPEKQFKWSCITDGCVCFSEVLLLFLILCFMIAIYVVKRFFRCRREKTLLNPLEPEINCEVDPYNSIDNFQVMVNERLQGSVESGLSGSYQCIKHSYSNGLNQMCKTQSKRGLGSEIKIPGSTESEISGSYNCIKDVRDNGMNTLYPNHTHQEMCSSGETLRQNDGSVNSGCYLDAIYDLKNSSDSDYLNPLNESTEGAVADLKMYKYKDVPKLCFNKRLLYSV